MDALPVEGGLLDQKAQQAPLSSDDGVGAAPINSADSPSKNNVNNDAFTTNNIMSPSVGDEPPSLSQAPLVAPEPDAVNNSKPSVNGASHPQDPLPNGTRGSLSLPSPPTESSLVNAPDHPSQPQPDPSLTSSGIATPSEIPPTAPSTSSAPVTVSQESVEGQPTPAEHIATESHPNPTTEAPEAEPSIPQEPPLATETPSNPETLLVSPEIVDIPPTTTIIEQEVSHSRQPMVPVTSEQAAEIEDQKHQADIAADPELAGSLAESTDQIEQDKMDYTMEVDPQPTESTVETSQLPDRTQTPNGINMAVESSAVSVPEQTNTDLLEDQKMQDAPASTKISREREDDTQENEHMAKRTKTEEVESSAAEFKVPGLPSSTPSRATENGLVEHPSAEVARTPMTAAQQKHLLKAIQTIKRSKSAVAFSNPVDPVALNIPTYFDIIKNPMDLGTMEKKLKGGSYSVVEELVSDFDLIISNSIAFNGPEHPVTHSGKTIRSSFDNHLAKLPPADAVELSAAERKAQKAQKVAASAKAAPHRRESRSVAIPKPPTHSAASPSNQTFALNPEGIPLIRRDSIAADGRPKREIHPPRNRGLEYGASKPKKKKYTWELKFSQHAWDEIMKPRYANMASPFYTPVDPVALNIPTYHKIIKKPMDLGTVGEKLKHGQYENAKEFEADMRLMFQNCYKFNPEGDYVYNLGKTLESEFDRIWEGKKKWIADNAPASNPQSQGTSPDPDEEEDEDDVAEEDEEEADDDGNDKLTQLQKQIAEMSKQVELIQKQKVSPPAAGKKSKSKASKKDKNPRPPAPAPGQKKKKSSRPEKIPFVTYDQKKLISDRINDLSEVKMSQALRIIRENVPHLRNVNEEEIELDIDELPNDVLYRLLQFVRSGTVHNAHDAELDAPTRKPVSHSQPTKPKKNKPMGKVEQEAQISSIQAKLAKFEKAGLGGEEQHAMRSIEQGQSSSDDDDDDESEEE